MSIKRFLSSLTLVVLGLHGSPNALAQVNQPAQPAPSEEAIYQTTMRRAKAGMSEPDRPGAREKWYEFWYGGRPLSLIHI